MSRRSLSLAMLLCLLLLAPAFGARSGGHDWPQWRGPGRDGIAATAGPDAWPAELTKVWSVPVGIGHAGPVVVGDRIYQFSRRDGEEGVVALDLTDGAEIWWSGHSAPYRMHPAARDHGEGPKATPALAAGRIFTLGIDGALTARDVADGRVLWRHDFSDRYPATSPIYGAAASPLVLGERVIAAIGGAGQGAIAAFDVASGARVWAYEEDGPGYASAVVATLDGRRQLITQTDAHIVGLDPDSGARLWRIPFKTDYDQNVVTPLVVGERVILGGLDHGVFAVRPRADTSVPEELWRNRDVSMYMSSPVLHGGRLYGFSHRRAGQLFALDADSGAPIWTSRGRDGENAAIVALGDDVLFLTDDGRLQVIPASSSDGTPRVTYTVADSPTWAHPVPVPNGILVKDLGHLTLWRWD